MNRFVIPYAAPPVARSHRMSLTLTTNRGPLADEALDAIAATYGTVDGRYASREFCRTVFNGNPLGYSHHAFVRDGDQIVGHYAVVPIRVRADGATVISGKGEALFLAEPHRASAVELPAGELPAGIALMNAVHDRALADGVAVVHNITTSEIGMIQRMQGFRALSVSLDQLHFLIAPTELRQLRRTPSRARAARILSVTQRVLLAIVRGVLWVARAPGTERDAPAHAERHISALAASDAGPRGTWAVSRDPETVRWLQRLGQLEVVSISGRPEHFAVMAKGNACELLLWNVPAGAWRDGLVIACALLDGSIEDRAWIMSVARRLAFERGRSLGLALRMLGFVPQSIPITVYAKSSDDFYLDSANLAFTRMFHL